jgi:F420-dependent oxidoreductase-like protein
MEPLAAFVTPGKSLAEATERVRLAEQVGYDSAFTSHIAQRDGLMVLAAYAAGTESIQLGTAVVPAFPRHPIAMATEAATLDELSGGRLILGIGTSHAATMQGWYGFEFAKPLTQLKEYTSIVRALIREGKVEHSGEFYTANFAFAGYAARPDLPIFVSGLSPNTLKWAGATADGVLLWCCLPSYIEGTVAPIIRAAEKEAGRPEGSCKIVAAVPTAATDDEDAVRSALRRDLLVYWTLPFYRRVIGAAGFEDDIARFDEKLSQGDAKGATANISDEFLDQIAAFGDPARIGKKLAEYRAAGTDVPMVGPVAMKPEAGSPEQTLETAIKA